MIGYPLSVGWVLRDQLLEGPAPRTFAHVLHLRSAGIKAVLSLCRKDEAQPPVKLEQYFISARLALPDHRSRESMQVDQLLHALALLDFCSDYGPVYVHCLAGIERSPLVCMAWLMRRRRLTPLQALDYMSQSHPLSNPLPCQLSLLCLISDMPQSTDYAFRA